LQYEPKVQFVGADINAFGQKAPNGQIVKFEDEGGQKVPGKQLSEGLLPVLSPAIEVPVQ
jgi:hypothetical protein